MGIHEHEGNLRLQRGVVGLSQNMVIVCKNPFLVFRDIGLGTVLGLEEAVELHAPDIPHIPEQIVLRIIHNGAVRMLHRQPPGYLVLGGVIVVGIVDLLVHNGLEIRVLGGIDRETAGVQQLLRLLRCIAQPLHQSFLHLLRQLIRKVGIRGIGLLHLDIGLLDAVVDRIRQCLLITILVDIALLQQILQHLRPPLGIVLRMGNGIQRRRILGDGGDNRTFRKGQVADFLIEIAPRRHLDAQGVRTQIDGIQVFRDNAVLHGFLVQLRLVLQLQRQILLLKLPHIAFKGSLMETPAEDIILKKLLGNGGAAACRIIVGDHALHGTENGLQVNAVVLPEAFVLYGHEGVDEILRQLLIGHALPVGALRHQRRHHLAVPVQGLRGIGRGTHMNGIDVRRGIQDALKQTEAEGHGQHRDGNAADQTQIGKKVGQPVPDPGPGTVQPIQCILNAVFSEFHLCLSSFRGHLPG